MATLTDLFNNQIEDEAAVESKMSVSDVSTVFNKQHDISPDYSMSRATTGAYHKTIQGLDTLGNLVYNLLPGEQDNSEYEARTKDRSIRVADASGFDEGGNIIQNNFVEDLPANIIGAVTGGLAYKAAAKTLGAGLALGENIASKVGYTPNSILVTGNKMGPWKKLGDEIGRATAETIPSVGLNEFTMGKIDKEGKVTNEAGITDWSTYLQTLTTEAVIGAAPGIAISRGIEAHNKYKVKKAADESLNSADLARLNLDKDALMAINKTGLKGLDDIVEKTTDSGGYIVLDDFIYELSKKEFKEKYGTDIPNTAVGKQQFDEILNANKEKWGSLDKIRNTDGINAAFVDSDLNILVKTDALGTVNGTLEFSPAYSENGGVAFDAIVDVKNSQFKDMAKYSAYDGKPIVDVNGYQMDKIKAIIDEIKAKEKPGSAMSEFDTVTVDDTGRIVIDDAKVKEYAQKAGLSEAEARSVIDKKLNDNKAFQAIKELDVIHHTGEAAVRGSDNVKITKNPLLQFFTAKNYSPEKALDFIKTYNDKTADTSRAVEAIATVLDSGGDLTHTLKRINFDMPVPTKDTMALEKELYDAIFNVVDNNGKPKYTTLKQEFIQALNTSFAKEVLKAVDDSGFIKSERISGKAIVNSLFNDTGYNIKGNVNLEGFKKNIADKLDEHLSDIDLGKKKDIEVDPKMERPVDVIEAKQEILDAANILGETENARANTLSQAFKQFSRDWSKGISGEVPTHTKDPYNITRYNKDILESAKKEAEYKWHVTEEGKELIEAILNDKPFSVGDATLDKIFMDEDTPLKTKLVVLSGAINKLNTTGKMTFADMLEAYKNLPDHVKANVDKTAEELITEAKDIFDTYTAFPNGHHYATVIDNQKRVRYDALTNPKTSKLAMMVMEIEGTTGNRIVNADGTLHTENVTKYKRGFLANFGKKPEKMTDAEVDIAFTNLINELDNAASAHIFVEEGIISIKSINDLRAFNRIISNPIANKDALFKMTSEIDGVTNAIANMNAQLGIIDSSTGIGSYIGGKDTYTRFQEIFSEITGATFTRNDVKSVVTGDFYLADTYTSTAALAEVILNKILLSSSNKGSNEAVIKAIAPWVFSEYKTIANFKNVAAQFEKINRYMEQYTALKNYIKEIGEGTITPENYKGYSDIAYIKKNVFKKIVNEVKDAKRSNANKYNMSDIDFALAIKRLSEGKELSDGQRNAFINKFTKTFHDDTTRALETLYKDPMFMSDGGKYSLILKYRELNKKVSEHNSFLIAGILTSRDFIRSTGDVKAKIKDIMTTVDGRLTDDSVPMMHMYDWANSMVKSNKTLSVVDVLEEMGKRGYLRDNVMSAKSIQTVLGNVETYAGSIPFYSFKGYAGYSPNTRTNFGSITIAGVHLPIQNIAYDAMVMAHMQNTASTPFLNKFDAIIGDPVSLAPIAKAGNEAEAGVLKFANPADDMLNTLGTLEKQAGTMTRYDKAAATFMAQQRLMASKGKAMPDEVAKLTDEILKKETPSITSNSIKELADELTKLKEEIKNKKANLKENAVVEQYTNGDKSVVANLSEAYKHENSKKPVDFNDYVHNLTHLKNVEKSDAPIGYLRDSTVKSGVATVNPITKVVFDPNLETRGFMTDDGVLIIRGGKEDVINDINILETIYHEAGHGVISKTGNNYDDIISLMDHVMSKNKLEAFDMDDNLIGNALKGDITFDEYLVKVLGILKKNEAIIEQPGQLAARFNKTNLYEDIVKLKINGHEIVTTHDLRKVLALTDEADLKMLDIDVNKALSQLKKYEVDLAGVVNSSYHVRNVLLNTEYESFSPTFKNTWKRLADARDKIVDVNARIQTVPALELFQVDASREALEKLLALKNGMQNDLQMHTASAVEDMMNLIKEAGVDNYSKHLGRMELAGMSVTLKEIEAADSIQGYKEALISRLRTITGDLKSDMKNVGLSTKHLDEYVKKLAYGRYNPVKTNKNKMAKEFLERVYRDNNEAIHEKMPLVIEYFEKKSAYVRMFEEAGFEKPRHARAMKGAFELWASNPNAKRVAIEAMTLNNRFSDKNELFNGNIEINPQLAGKKLILVSKLKEGQKYVAKQIDAKGKERYVVEVTDESYRMWDQDAQVINPNLTDAERPYYRVGKKKHQVFINAQSILKSSDVIDVDFTQAYKRNYYNTRKTEIGMEMFNHQYQMFKEGGFIITREEHSRLIAQNPDMAKMFEELPKHNPISQQAGIHYYNVKYKHYIIGSEGKDINKLAKQFFGKNGFASVATKLAKVFFGGTRIFKGLVLQTRLSSYINSFMSSSVIYGLHADNPMAYAARVAEARSKIKEYRALIRKYVEASSKGDDASAIKREIEEHDLHFAFRHGIADTIRKDAGTTGTYGENEVFIELSKIFGKDAADKLKPLALDPKVKLANEIGNIYDATELYPKVALFLDGIKSKSVPAGMKPRDYAIQKVLMAFPTYNNLNPMLNVIDSFSPFTKYMANFPKMFMYTLDQHPYRFMPLHASYLILPPATFNRGDAYEEKLAESGFMKIGDYAWYYESAYPFSLPDKSFGDSNMGVLGTVMNYDFLATAPGTILDFTPAFRLKSSE